MPHTTDFGRAYCIARLSSAQSLAQLAKIWDGIGDHYRRDAQVVAHKDKLKGVLT